MRVSTASKLAEKIGLSKGRVSQMRKEPWFPQPGEDGSWDVEEVRKAIARNVTPRRPKNPAPAARSVAPQATGPANPPQRSRSAETADHAAHGTHEASLAVMENPEASAVEQSKAARQLAAKAFAEAVREGKLGPATIDGFKKSLEEQRRTESGFLELQKKRGELIPRAVCIMLCAALARRLVKPLDQVETSLPNQVLIWLGDEELAEHGPEDIKRTVKQWWHGYARDIRELEADDVQTLLDEKVGELQVDEGEAG